MIGATVSHYKILEKLGEGGMGVVYKAEDTRLRRTVALKFLPPELIQSTEWKERFIREAQAAAALAHPNICTIHEIDEAESQAFIAMECIDGRSLTDIMGSGHLDTDKAINIVLRVAEGLSHAHKRGIVHRDIKPANIMVTEDGQAKIMDFGLAKLTGKSKLTRTATVMGTVAYMSPEQARGDTSIDHRTDIWSLGVLLYEMLAGALPFDAETDTGVIYKIINEAPEPIREVPAALEEVVQKMLQKGPAERYQDMDFLIKDLNSIELGKAAIMETRSPSIAVLPFVDMSPGRDQEYFCDGMSEALINELTHIEDLKVIARTSAFSFKGKSVNVRDIGRELEVGTILEGSVQKAGNRLRITAQLVDTERGHHLWSEKFDRQMDDVFAIQDEITLAIVGKLKPKLLGEQQLRLAKRPTVDREAYSLCLKGRWHAERRTEEGLRKAFEYYNEAIQKDPDCATAYAGLALLYVFLAVFAFFPPRETLPKAKEAALKALEIDDTLSEAHRSLAVVQTMHDWDWKGAEKEHRRAIELNPGNAGALLGYALFLSYLARHDEARETIDRAIELDPLDPILYHTRGTVLYYARRYDEAMDELKTGIEMAPNRVHGHLWLGIAYMQKSMYEEAMAKFEQERVISAGLNPLVEMFMGLAYAEMGKEAEARRMLEQVLERSKQGYIPPTIPAAMHFALGEIDKGFEWLDKGYKERDYWLCYLMIEPRLDSVRSDPRFKALLKKIGLDK